MIPVLSREACVIDTTVDRNSAKQVAVLCPTELLVEGEGDRGGHDTVSNVKLSCVLVASLRHCFVVMIFGYGHLALFVCFLLDCCCRCKARTSRPTRMKRRLGGNGPMAMATHRHRFLCWITSLPLSACGYVPCLPPFHTCVRHKLHVQTTC